MTLHTSKTKTLSLGGHSAPKARKATMATFTALALIAISASFTPAQAAPRAHVDVRVNVGGPNYHQDRAYHEDQVTRQDPIFRRIGATRARIDRLSDHRAISRFEARRLNDNLDEIAFDARMALRGRGTDYRLLASADARLEHLSDRLDDKRFRRIDWRR